MIIQELGVGWGHRYQTAKTIKLRLCAERCAKWWGCCKGCGGTDAAKERPGNKMHTHDPNAASVLLTLEQGQTS